MRSGVCMYVPLLLATFWCNINHFLSLLLLLLLLSTTTFVFCCFSSCFLCSKLIIICYISNTHRTTGWWMSIVSDWVSFLGQRKDHVKRKAESTYEGRKRHAFQCQWIGIASNKLSSGYVILFQDILESNRAVAARFVMNGVVGVVVINATFPVLTHQIVSDDVD